MLEKALKELIEKSLEKDFVKTNNGGYSVRHFGSVRRLSPKFEQKIQNAQISRQRKT